MNLDNQCLEEEIVGIMLLKKAFGHLKQELAPYAQQWTCFEEIKSRIDDWIDYYNNDRFQMGLEKLTPKEFYYYSTTGINPGELN